MVMMASAGGRWEVPRKIPANASTATTARRCHGAEGRGTAQAPSLIPFDWSYAEALELIRHPVCNMPPVPASAVSDAQVAQIVAYLKTIK